MKFFQQSDISTSMRSITYELISFKLHKAMNFKYETKSYFGLCERLKKICLVGKYYL